MLISRDIVKVLDEFRIEKKIKIQDFTNEIMSRKKYTRLLNSEADITFLEISLLIEKMHITFNQFSQYMTALIEKKYKEEMNFFIAMLNESYDYAYNQIFNKLDQRTLKTIIGYPAVYSLMELLKAIKGKQSMQTSINILNQSFNIKTQLKSKIITDGDIGLIFSYAKLGDDTLKSQIADYVYKVVFSKDYRFYLSFNDFSLISFYSIGLYCFISLKKMNIEQERKMNELIIFILDFLGANSLTVKDHQIFQLLHDYCIKNNINNKYVSYYYISSYIGIENRDDYQFNFKYTKQDLDNFSTVLNEPNLNEFGLYKKVMLNGKI